MALYFYRNLLTNALVYSDQSAPPEGNRNMELIGEQTNMSPTNPTNWVYHRLRSTFASVEKDDRVSGKISGLTRMYGMFDSCSSLTSIDLSGFDTSKVTSMNNMFNGCSNLRILAISGSMSNALSRLPASQYYPASGGDPVARENLTAGTWVRDEADLSLMSTIVQQAQMAMSLRRQISSLSQRVVNLESLIAEQ